MTAAIREAEDIRRMQHAIHVSVSDKLKTDYRKAIRRKAKELREYCRYRGIDFDELMRATVN